MTTNQYFYCYSPALRKYLMEAGERYICVGLNERTSSKFFLFLKTDSLDALLTTYRGGAAE